MDSTITDQSAVETPEAIATAVSGLDSLDGIADRVQWAGKRLRGLGPRVEGILSGTWLGHPLHPPLTDVVVGAWTSSLLLDVLGGKGGEKAADRLIGVGMAAAVPTALAGLADAADLRGGTRRAAAAHALGNSTALTLYGLSLLARGSGRRRTGQVLSLAGFCLASGSAWLGGHLSFGRAVGVNQAALEQLPSDWTPALPLDELEEGTLERRDVGGAQVLLVKQGVTVFAMSDRCSHRGCSLAEGELDGETIVCPCHGSTFRLDGSVVRGPATAPQPRLETRIREEMVEVRTHGS